MKHLKRFNEEMDQSDENSHTGYDEMGNSLNYDGDTIPMSDDEGKLPLSVTINIDNSVISTCLEYGIHEEQIEEVFKAYLDHILGYDAHGDDGFSDWLEYNADDWVN
jgi:hypothetical protein|tara:strand:- start:172 stop:492 length:321 start_codon:yes stop_codon:yes gene_type:complete